MKRLNCFFYALKRWIEKFEGYVAFRISLHFVGIHWFYISPDRKTWYQYAPKLAKSNVFAAAIDKLWYKGEEIVRESENGDPSYDLYLSLVKLHPLIDKNSTPWKAHSFARKELIAYESKIANLKT